MSMQRRRRYLYVNEQKLGFNNLVNLWYNFHGSFFNTLMKNGFKISAFNRFLLIKQGLKLKEKGDPYLIFLVALISIYPKIKLHQKKIFGAVINLPLPVTEKKGVALAVKWALRLLKNKKWSIKVSTIVDNKGVAIDKMNTWHQSTVPFIDYLLNKRKLSRLKFFFYK